MRIVVAGSSGLIGSVLVGSLRADGADVVRLVRGPAVGPDEVTWDPAAGVLEPEALAGADAVVNLCGAGVGDRRWSDARKRELVASRVDPTTLLARTLASMGMDRPPCLVNGSAVGWYGDRGDALVDESEPAGTDFLSRLTTEWEAATGPAADAGVRVVTARTAIVVTDRGGALGRQLPLFRLGLGGRLAGGRWWFPWISLTDEVRALRRCCTDDALSGPVNLVAPEPVTNAAFTRALAARLRRPAFMHVPGPALRLVLGEMASSITASIRATPHRLLAAGFEFEHPSLEAALAAEVK